MPRPYEDSDVYRFLLRSIISQQLSTKAAAAIYGRFNGLFKDGYPRPDLLLKKTDERLRSVGLSKQKADYLRNTARFAAAGGIEQSSMQKMKDQELIDHLTAIKGVGRWTVQMVLIFPLNRPDVFAPADLGIQKAMQKYCGLKVTGRRLQEEMTETAEMWRPHRTVACRLLWNAMS